MIDLDKSISIALAKSEYKNASDLSCKTGVTPSLITRMRKNGPDIKIGSIASVASAFGLSVSEFIAIGEGK